MKYQRAAAFVADVRRLTSAERDTFKKVVRERFVPAAERIAETPGTRWPRALRVKRVQGASGIWEMTWSWPDGRATFESIEIDGEPAIRWRRVGGHEIFDDAARS